MADAPTLDFAHLPHAAPVPSETRDQALADPGFGSLFTDHMVTIAFDADRVERGEEGWHDAKLCPREPIALDPAAAVLHYAQEIFEGMKAYVDDIAQSASGSNGDSVVADLLPAALQLIKTLQGQGLSLSAKSFVVASSHSVAEELARAISAIQDPLLIAQPCCCNCRTKVKDWT